MIVYPITKIKHIRFRHFDIDSHFQKCTSAKHYKKIETTNIVSLESSMQMVII